jgi:transposase
MLGKCSEEVEMYQMVTMEDLVPTGHLLRRLRDALDLSFVREMVAARYSGIGRPSIDPEVVVRMLVLQYLFDFSERQICDEVRMHGGYRWFCGLSFNDRVPDQSTLVKLRVHKWAGTDIWAHVLQATVCACEAAGIAHRDRLAVDGTQITANAAVKSLEEIPAPLKLEVAQSCTQPASEPPEASVAPPPLSVKEGERKQGARRSGDPDWHGEKFSNATHRSTTDPDSRLYRKGRVQETKLRFLGHYLADVTSGVILGAMATQATGVAEREAACALLDGLSELPDDLVMDLGYRDGDFLAQVMDRGVVPLVALGHESLEAEPEWKRETRDLERRRKRAELLAAARARNATRLAARTASGRRAQRQRTRIEHLYGEAKEHHGLGRARGRGLSRVDDQVKLTAIVQNLKRLAAGNRVRRAAAASLRSLASRNRRVVSSHGAFCKPRRALRPRFGATHAPYAGRYTRPFSRAKREVARESGV